MYDYFKGTLTDLSPTKAVVETSGVGYSLLIPVNVYSLLCGLLGTSITLFVSFVIREDSHRLFGFSQKKERELFEKLSDVSGIGPKTALAIIGHLTLEELDLAIFEQDVTTLSRVPGIGKKTAERLIVELKDKLKNLKPLLEKEGEDMSKQSPLMKDALAALIHLGYHQNMAQKAIKKALEESPEALKLGALITAALRLVHLG